MRRALRHIGSGLLLTGCLVLAGCGDSAPSSPTAADLAKIDLSPDHTITVDEGGFEPDTLQVKAGDVIRLVNKGTRPHSFTAEERFDTGRMQPGDTTTMVLTKPAGIPYLDIEAPGHKATLTVVEAPDRR